MSHEEFIEANPCTRLRYDGLLFLGGVSIVLVSYLAENSAGDASRLRAIINAVCLLTALSAFAGSAWFVKLARRVAAEMRFPPALMAVPVRTRIVRGAKAQRQATACYLFSGILTAAGAACLHVVWVVEHLSS